MCKDSASFPVKKAAGSFSIEAAGSFTIEAAVIFPIILCIVVFILYSCFYLHDDMVIQETAHEVAIYGTTLDYKETREMKNLMSKKYQKSVEGRLLATKVHKIEMKFEDGKVKITICGIMKNVVSGMFPGYKGLKISATREAEFTDPVKTVKWMSVYWKMQKDKDEGKK